MLLAMACSLPAPHCAAEVNRLKDMPHAFASVCVHGLAGDGDVQCFDRFPLDTILDCGSAAPLTAYDGGSGTMRLHFDGPDISPDIVVRYGVRSYARNYWPGGQDVLLVFPLEGSAEIEGFGDGMETCKEYGAD